MDKCTKLFNAVYMVLMEHDLIQVDHDEEKKKQDAFIDCMPMLKKFVEHDDIDLHEWLSKLLVQLNITASDKENLNEIFSMILLEIQNLKDRLTVQESKIQSQELRIQALELNQQMRDINIKAFDIVKLFRSYFLDDIIKGEYPQLETWSKFTNEWSLREQTVMELLKIDRTIVDPKEDLNVQGHPRVRTFIEPIESKLKKETMLALKLVDLSKMANDRHQYAHEPTRTVEEQRDIIRKCLKHVYPAEYNYTLMLKNMVLKLAELDKDPSNTKLKDFHK